MEWKEAIRRIKNGRESRAINRLFGEEHYFPEYSIPTFYPSTQDIPLSMPGLYFLWDGVDLDYIGASSACVRHAIKRGKMYHSDKHIISAIKIWDWRECDIIRQFLIVTRRPSRNPYMSPGKPGRPAEDLEERFWAKVEPHDEEKWDGGCRLWLGSVNSKGYGRVRVQGKLCLAHRVAYELSKGEIPPGARVLRICNNKLCCNPIHMELKYPKGQVPLAEMEEGKRADHLRVLTGTSDPAEQQRIMKKLVWWESEAVT